MLVELALIGGVSTATLALGLALLCRPDRMVAYQERYAERFATVGPEDDPDYYDDTRKARRDTFRFGGFVMTVVGLCFLGIAVYGALFV